MVLPSSVFKTADLLLVFPKKTSSSEDWQLMLSCVLMTLLANFCKEVKDEVLCVRQL